MSQLAELERTIKLGTIQILESVKGVKVDGTTDNDLGYNYAVHQINSRIDKAITMLRGEDNESGTFQK